MNARLPINVVVTRPPVDWQTAVVDAARGLDFPGERVLFEESTEGLIVHALTELDLELAIHELRKIFPELQHGKPQVAYDMGPPLMEPYYRATIDMPEENLGAVMGDMCSRRALLEAVGDTDEGKRLVAEVPVSECFGYGTVLRALTHGRGRYAVEYAGYQTAPYQGAEPDDAA